MSRKEREERLQSNLGGCERLGRTAGEARFAFPKPQDPTPPRRPFDWARDRWEW